MIEEYTRPVLDGIQTAIATLLQIQASLVTIKIQAGSVVLQVTIPADYLLAFQATVQSGYTLNGKLVEAFSKSPPSPLPTSPSPTTSSPSISQIQPKWNLGPWQSCSVLCNGGTQARVVACVNLVGGSDLDESKCQQEALKPATARA